MEKAIIRKIAMLSAVLMMVLTGIYVAYATKETTTDGRYRGLVYYAFLYQGEPAKWYYPEELGIFEINDFEAGETATWLQVGSTEEWSEVENLIFKWERNGRFYQISYLNVTPGQPQPVSYLVIGGVRIAGGWCFTGVFGILYWRRKE
ncbi:MAG: hypothetical protein QHH17_07170 [Candidatus Bathyarchaeota archaeon]|jgi:hypothetical protein|nr:hypothetical protein [Candidatus Bathyarchaeota archaeon]